MDQIILTSLKTIPFFAKNPHIFQDLCDPQKRMKAIIGAVQSGKTEVICGLAVYIIKVIRMPVIVVVQEYNAHVEQLLNNFQRGGRFGTDELRVDASCIRDIDPSSWVFHQDPYTTPTLTVCLENPAQLKKLVEAIPEEPHPFFLIADEADAIGYKNPKALPKCYHEFQQIRNRATEFIAVTATAFDIIYMDNDLKNNCIYKLPHPENYKGLEKVGIWELDNNFNFGVTKKDERVPHSGPPTPLRGARLGRTSSVTLSTDLEQFYIDLLEEKQPTPSHPIICLNKTETKIEEERWMLKAFADHPILKQYCVIVFNGQGIDLYNPHMDVNHLRTYFKIKKPKKKDHSKGLLQSVANVVFVEKAGSREVLQYVKIHLKMTTHIVIIAGQIVNRGLNIVSTDYVWHLTHQLLRVSSVATCGDMYQAVRLYGRYNDNISLKLYMTEKDARALEQTYYLQEKILKEADNRVVIHETIMSMKDVCYGIKLLKEDIPKRRTTKKVQEPKWTVMKRETPQKEEWRRDIKLRTNTLRAVKRCFEQRDRSQKNTRFLKQLQPNIMYTFKELQDLLLDVYGYVPQTSRIEALYGLEGTPNVMFAEDRLILFYQYAKEDGTYFYTVNPEITRLFEDNK